jgi:hypothetical protein
VLDRSEIGLCEGESPEIGPLCFISCADETNGAARHQLSIPAVSIRIDSFSAPAPAEELAVHDLMYGIHRAGKNMFMFQ